MARLCPGQTADRRQGPAVCPSHKIQLSKNLILPRPGFGRLGMGGGRLARAHSVLASALPRCRVLRCFRSASHNLASPGARRIGVRQAGRSFWCFGIALLKPAEASDGPECGRSKQNDLLMTWNGAVYSKIDSLW